MGNIEIIGLEGLPEFDTSHDLPKLIMNLPSPRLEG